MKDISDVSFTSDTPPERFASPSPSRKQLFGDGAGRPRGRLRKLLPSGRGWLIVGALALCGAVVGAYFGLREEPVFPLEKVIVEGRTRLTADEALGLSGLQRGTNLLDADLAGAAARIQQALPFARSAHVERDLPSTLRIRIEERKPTLLVAMQHLYVADETGHLYRRLQPGDVRALPVLTGLTRTDATGRPKHVAEVVTGALDLVRALGSRCTDEIAFNEVRGYTAFLCGGPEVRLGKPPFADKQPQLERALGSTKRAKVIHLDDDKQPTRVVVRVGREGA